MGSTASMANGAINQLMLVVKTSAGVTVRYEIAGGNLSEQI